MPRVVILGPQRFQPTVAAALESIRAPGPIAVVTAGWQEREEEVDELQAHVAREVINLRLYARAEEVLAGDPPLAEALRERQDSLQELQRLYRTRLAHALAAAREIMSHSGSGPFLDEHRRAAVSAVRTIDRQHLGRLRRLHLEFTAEWNPSRRPLVQAHREELAGLLQRVDVLAIAGGHVAVLLNRLRIFDLVELAGERPIVAWSAGAMALAERVVLFHDSPPQGPGDAEVFDAGLAAFPDLVPLPHAAARLDLENPVRVALFSRRFAPATCVALDDGVRMEWNDGSWLPGPGARVLGRRGRLREMVGA